MSGSNQFTVRMDRDLIERFKARCEQQGHSHPEVTRILLRDYAEGRIDVGAIASPVKSNLKEALR